MLKKHKVLNVFLSTFDKFYKGAQPSSPQRNYVDVHLLLRPLRLSPDRAAAVARDAEIKILFFPYLCFIAKVYMRALLTTGKFCVARGPHFVL
jgi:hypothetical protein